ncbi:bifunctional transcriptional activator/DNA repair enzyme AdaA [Falsibacillus pallidus]|uniref:bifunctional transcriptional activator/DNA repair enzyme AdaA n=1 Tax=Falsibacillus pallidus TaxID=493781 RepID=UPI003D96B0E9
MQKVTMSFDEKWEQVLQCNGNYDGMFYTAVKTTKIYCRPSCRSRKPKKENVEFYDSRDEAKDAGYRACKRCQPDAPFSPQLTLISTVFDYFHKHYNQRIKLQDIANHAGVSMYYLERFFKKETRKTLNEMLEIIRIDKAASLLKSTDKTNLEICYEAGFQSPSNFYKSFRKVKGFTPSDYRKRFQETTLQ